MRIKIDASSGVPIYLQIVNQVRTQVALGQLKPEDPLPSVRQLAADLVVNPNTIARAYLDLEHQGIIYKRAGQGTYVSLRAVEMSKNERVRIFSELLEKALVEGLHLELDHSEMESVFRDLMTRVNGRDENGARGES
ncbi:MAG: GntR family transcriptional regulator [Acidobacteria bacterium]|nr:MAG: GntR family transcriptional regulator [Acidobacteriota bacterium]